MTVISVSPRRRNLDSPLLPNVIGRSGSGAAVPLQIAGGQAATSLIDPLMLVANGRHIDSNRPARPGLTLIS
jgi:hypothetical protein